MLEIARKILSRIWYKRSIFLLIRDSFEFKLLEDKFVGTFEGIEDTNVELCSNFDSDSTIQLYKRFLKLGTYKGDVGFFYGRCVYRQWLQTVGDVDFDGCKILSLKKGEVYSCRVYCEPLARGYGFQRHGLQRQIAMYPNYKFYSMVLPEKGVSLSNYLLLGYRIDSLITVYSLLGVRWHTKDKYCVKCG